ncbi:PASTA domain-containing protein, partial [Spongiactinospora gelatinilytica]|uniref:PASTA domain-containing protein n=1 Tax=Spongiactinospora gelatinilytica TaxID=2666298 RepID=UPI001F1A4EAE
TLWRRLAKTARLMLRRAPVGVVLHRLGGGVALGGDRDAPHVEATPTLTVSPSPSAAPTKTPSPTPSPTPRPKKPVPDVGGLTLAEARPMIKAAGFKVQAQLNGGGQVLACHTVVFQEPAAGEKLELGRSMMILFDPENGCESPSPQPTPTPSLSKVPVGR